MTDTLRPPRPLRQSLRKLAPYFTEQRTRLGLVILLTITGAGAAACEPLVLKALFDGFLSESQFQKSIPTLLGFIGLLLGHELLQLIQDRLFWRVRLAVDFALLRDTVDRLHALPLSYHRNASIGATMTKIERGVSGAMSAFTEIILQLFPALIYLSVSVVVMLRIDVRLSLVVLAFAPLPAIIGAIASKEQAVREQTLMQRWARIFARFNEVLSGIVVVKSFVMEEQEKRRFLGDVRQANEVVLRGVGTDSKVNSLRNVMMLLARCAALALGGALVMNGEITLGTLLAFVAYLGGLFQPVQTLTGMYQTLRRAAVSVDAILSILEAEDALGDAPHARDPGALSGCIEFRGVNFGYREDSALLKDINLRVEPGEVVALVGPSGAGKSTMMALLQRLYDPCSGAILVDGQDLRDLKQRALRSQISVVLQEGTLFSDTVGDNIAFGRPGATRDEIERAARAANAHDFISALPEGYETRVGERGSKLSGGERQRIAIARALLKNAPILILDEATSALDAENEQQVQQALTRLCEGKTTFVIAHRLSTVTSADRIIVLKNGAISESGTHQELMFRNGYYASLVAQQVRGLILDAA